MTAAKAKLAVFAMRISQIVPCLECPLLEKKMPRRKRKNDPSAIQTTSTIRTLKGGNESVRCGLDTTYIEYAHKENSNVRTCS